MDRRFIESIIEISDETLNNNKRWEDIKFHPTCQIYLIKLSKDLFASLASIDSYDKTSNLIYVPTYDKISNWISANLPLNFGFIIKKTNNIWESTPQETLTSSKDMIMTEFWKSIIDDFIKWSFSNNLEGQVYLPWDIQKFIMNTYPNFLVNDDKLPVTFIVNGNPNTFNISFDLMMGIMLFSFVAGRDFQATMFNDVINKLPRGLSSELDNEIKATKSIISRSLFDITLDKGYLVDIGKNTFQFESPDFIQGWSTGALWANVDPYSYLENLRSYQVSSDGELITTQLELY